MKLNRPYSLIAANVAGLLCAVPASAEQPYHPPGANLVLGDVTHGQRAQSASGNPAAPAADYARNEGRRLRGTVITGAAGIEYGNIDKLWELYDQIVQSYEPSPPDSDVVPRSTNRRCTSCRLFSRASVNRSSSIVS